MTLYKTNWDNNRYLSYDEISLQLDAMAQEIREKQYDEIGVVLRGGFFIGTHLAFLTGLPLFFLTYDRKEQEARWVGAPPQGKRILLCEDSAGKGYTLSNCIDYLEQQEYIVDTFVVCQMPQSRVKSKYVCFSWENDDVRILYPWNRYRINPESKSDKKMDHEYEKVFKMLSFNSQMEKLNIQTTGEEIIKNGYTHLVISEPEYAIELASRFPELRVSWWNGKEEIAIQAAKMKNTP